ncbi:hypothetical protein F5Y02DRAFT_428264 [Annulohypoxylon stygium]|nr:hypothetical protein F5Y02DRAFT_428264 [Annulohypoxylon stygium]
MSHQEPYNSDGEVYLPGGSGLYITTTKNGKPAFGRKKKGRLLEDHGFDILGQAFGIPSRIDFEREAEREVRRRKTFMVRSPTPRTSREKSTTAHDFYKHGSYVLPMNKSLPSAFPFTSTRIHRETESRPSCSSHGKESETKDANLAPMSSHPPAIPSPSSPHMWEFGNTMAVSPNNGFPTTSSTKPQEYAVQNPVPGSFPRPWPTLASVPHHLQSPIHSASQPVASPPFFHHIQMMPQYQEVRNPVCPTPGSLFTPVPPHQSLLVTTPLPTTQPRDGLSTVALKGSLPLRYSPSEVRKCEEHYKASRKSTLQGTDKYESNGKERRGNKRDIGKHIQHIHVCAGCGRIRSRRYHSEHPLKRGQIPERDYCARCQHEAALVENDDTDNTDDDNTDINVDMSCTNCSITRNTKKASGATKQKSSGISSSSSILTASTIVEDHTIRPPSIPSTGESNADDFALARGSKIGQIGGRCSSLYAGETVQAVDDTPLSKSCTPKEDKEASLKEYIHVKSPNSAANVGREDPKRAASKIRLKDVLRNTYANDTCISSEAPSPEGHSGFAHLPSGLVSEVRPRAPLQSVSNHSGVASPCHDIHNEIAMPTDEDYYYRGTSDRTREPKARYYIDHNDNSRDKQTTNEAYGSVREYKAPYESTVNYRMYEPQARACTTHGLSQQGRSHRRRVRRHQYGGWTYNYEHGKRPTDDTAELKTLHEPECVSGWDLPPTPTELPRPYQTTDPYLVSESWNAYHTGEEEPGQGFEWTAEEDLLSAAKFFDGMTNPIYGFDATPPDCMTHTEISVESYYSCTGADGSVIPPAAYELYETSELGSTGNEGSRRKTLEFSSKVDRDKKMAKRIDSGTPSTYRNRQKPGERQSEPSPKRREKTYYSDRRVSSSSLHLSSPDPASSTIAHTGHSLEGLRPDLNDHSNLAVGGKRKSIRQLLKL